MTTCTEVAEGAEPGFRPWRRACSASTRLNSPMRPRTTTRCRRHRERRSPVHRLRGGCVPAGQHCDVTGDLRPNTAASYERLTRIHVVGRLGAVRLPQLTPGHVERVCQAVLADGPAPSSVAKVVQVLSLMLELAVREGAVVANPVARAQLPRQSRSPSPSCRRVRWTASSRMPPAPRTLDVPVTDRLEQLLRSHRKLVAARRLGGRHVGRDRCPVPNAARHPPVDPQRAAPLPRSRPRARAADRHVTAHAAPHLGVGRSGGPIFLVSRYAGHATIQTTADQYGHLVPGDEQTAELTHTTLGRAFRPGA